MTTGKTLIVGTRGSRLARAQTDGVVALLRERCPDAASRSASSAPPATCDQQPLSEIAGEGVFTKELESALLSGEIDIAVHSLKDLPTDLARGLTLAAITRREDPSDALVSRDKTPLASCGRERASAPERSPRRPVRLLRPEVEPVPIRGNVDTRVRKAESGEGVDAVIIAAAPSRGSAGSTERRRSSPSKRCCPRRARAPSPSKRAATTKKRSASPPSPTTAIRIWRLLPNAPSCDGSAAAAGSPSPRLASSKSGKLRLTGLVVDPDRHGAPSGRRSRQPRRRRVAGRDAWPTTCCTEARPRFLKDCRHERSGQGLARRRRPGRPRPHHRCGRRRARARGSRRLRPAGEPPPPRPRAAECGAHLRRQARAGRGRLRLQPAADQRPAGRQGAARASASSGSRAATRSCSAAAAKRRRRWWRRASRSRSCPASRRPSPCPPTPASRSRTVACRPRSPSSPATKTPTRRRAPSTGDAREERRHARHPDGRREPGRIVKLLVDGGRSPTSRSPSSAGERRLTSASSRATSPTSRQRRRSETNAAAGHRRRPRRAPARDAPLVRQSAALRQARPGDPRPRAGRRPLARPVRGRRRAHRASRHRDRAAHRPAGAGGRPSNASPPPSTTGSVFTSANGVDIFFDERREGGDARAFGGARVCAIGPGTAVALAAHGVQADLVPERFLAEAWSRRWQRSEGPAHPLPRAGGARRALVPGLRDLGATVDELPLYSAPCRRSTPEPCATAGPRDRCCHLRQLVGGEEPDEDVGGATRRPLEKPLIACIGPVTAAAARERAWRWTWSRRSTPSRG